MSCTISNLTNEKNNEEARADVTDDRSIHSDRLYHHNAASIIVTLQTGSQPVATRQLL